MVDAFDRDLVTLDHAARRTPVAAGTAALLDEPLEARRRAATPTGSTRTAVATP